MFVYSINAMCMACVLFPARCSLSVGRMNGSKDCALEAKRTSLDRDMPRPGARRENPPGAWCVG